MFSDRIVDEMVYEQIEQERLRQKLQQIVLQYPNEFQHESTNPAVTSIPIPPEWKVVWQTSQIAFTILLFVVALWLAAAPG